MVRKTAAQSWRGFIRGQHVITLISTRGATADDREITHPDGALATISSVADFGEFQGKGVDVIIGEGENAICNSFDERDVANLGRIPFAPIS